MSSYTIPVQIRWSDIDANRHLRHSAYYDYGAMARVNFLTSMGLSTQKMEEIRLGPVIFREEALFKREIHFEDEIVIDIECTQASTDYSRWSIRHTITKKDGTVAAVISLDGAWIDLDKRKLGVPDATVRSAFDAMPRSADFKPIVRG